MGGWGNDYNSSPSVEMADSATEAASPEEIAEISTEVEENGDSITALELGLEDIQNQIDMVASTVDQIDNLTQANDGMIQTIQSDLDTLFSSVEMQGSAINNHTSQIDDLDFRLTELEDTEVNDMLYLYKKGSIDDFSNLNAEDLAP